MQTQLFLAGLGALLVASLLTLPFISNLSQTGRRATSILICLGNGLFLALAATVLATDQSFLINIGQFTPELQFSFHIDRLAALFILIISIVAISVTIYSVVYIEHRESPSQKNLMLSLMSMFILSMLLVVAADNGFALLFFWETMSISSFLLVMFDYQKKETQKAALFYFVMTQMSTVFLLFGVLTIFRSTGSFTIQLANLPPALNASVFLSIFVGFGIKAGVMPFHKWLPYAHSASPSNISALMSGVMIKVAIYGIVRYLLFVLNPELWWGVMIMVFGVVSAFLGVIYALKEHDIKKLLAYHSIENIGIILMGVGLYLIFENYGLRQLALLSLLGGLFHTLNHAIFKSLLFLTAGSVVNNTHTRNIEEMGGLIKTMPYTGVLFLIGALAISALPPLNGFVSELMLFQAFFQSLTIASPVVRLLMFAGMSFFAITSALAAACFVKAFGVIFLATPRSTHAQQAREASLPMIIGPAILASLCVVLGIFSFQIFTTLGYDVPIPNMLVIGILLIFILLLTWVILRLSSTRKTRISETWGCGIVSQNSKMEYTATGFSEPILTIFRPIYRTNKTILRNFIDKQESIFKNGYTEIHTLKIFEEKIYLPVVNAVKRVSKLVSDLQNVDLETYILYSFVAIVILLLAAGWIL